MYVTVYIMYIRGSWLLNDSTPAQEWGSNQTQMKILPVSLGSVSLHTHLAFLDP